MEASYSWLKAPRWKGRAVEVGPLARVLMLYAKGHEPTVELAKMALTKLDLPLEAMYSTMGRTAARTLETKIIAGQMLGWLGHAHRQHQGAATSACTTPSCGSRPPGRARRGAWASWRRRAGRSRIGSSSRTGKIDNYQAVVPSTWNAGPRDGKGQPGAV